MKSKLCWIPFIPVTIAVIVLKVCETLNVFPLLPTNTLSYISIGLVLLMFAVNIVFTIADKDEAWVLEVLRGRRYVARRCPDDAVVVHPNCLTIGKLKPGDVVAPCFATKGADFDFIRSYQGPRTWKSDYNHYRWRGSYITVAGVDVGEPAEYPFSVKPAHPVSADDVKRGLRSHYEGMPWQIPLKHPVDGPKNVVPVCRNGTQQSMVCMFAEDPSDVEIHVAVGRPCERQYVRCRPFAGELPPGAVTGAAALKRLEDHWLPGP